MSRSPTPATLGSQVAQDAHRNESAAGGSVQWDESVSESRRLVLLDPQTSGGLMAAVPPDQAEDAASALDAAGYTASVIGEFVESSDKGVTIRVLG